MSIKKIQARGTVLAVTISATYTAVPGIISIDKPGEGNQYYESTTLDGPIQETHDNVGFVKVPEISFEFFYDPTNTVHILLKTTMRNPVSTIPTGQVSPGTLWKLTYTDSGPLDEIWNVVGLTIDEKFATKDGVKSTCKLQTSGVPSA